MPTLFWNCASRFKEIIYAHCKVHLVRFRGANASLLKRQPCTALLFPVVATTGVVASILFCEDSQGGTPRLLSLKSHGGNTTREARYKQDCALIDLSSYNKVVVDLNRMIVTAGASVTMEQLTAQCLIHGVVPLVVPEFKNITVGGAVMGASLESSSGKHGEFSETCRNFKVRLGSGEVVDCSESERRDLFDAIPGSYGSLAFLLTADIRVMRAAPHIRLNYKWFDDLDTAVACLLNAAGSHDFAEALSYPDPGQGNAVITADFEHSPCTSVTSITQPSDPWFYEHVLALKTTGGRDELVSTFDYLHRHERGAFWMARPEGDRIRGTFGGFLFGSLSSPPLRAWFDEYWKTSFLFKVLRWAPQAIISDNFVITDVYVEPEDVEALVQEARVGQFALATPIWLCPVRVPKRHQPFSPHGHKGGHDAVLIDVGLYGRVLQHAGIAAGRHFEVWGMKHNTRKMLYSQNYFSEDEFWSKPMFDKQVYQDLRRKYGAEGVLVDLYTKVGNSRANIEQSRHHWKYSWWSWLSQHT